MGQLLVISAGAGSGKTHRICDEIADRIAGGLDPARVLATTFTRKAAAELKGRIEERLLRERSLSSAKRVELTERLQLAAIGTVHSVGHHLMNRFALELGLSPNLEVMDEVSSEWHLMQLIAQMDQGPWEELRELCRRLGQGRPHRWTLRLLDVKRSNCISAEDFGEQMEESSIRLLEVIGGGGGLLRDDDPGAIYQLAETALASISALGDSKGVTRDCVGRLQSLVASSSPRWKDWLVAGKLEAGKRNPPANDELVPLRNLASTVRQQRALHDDIRNLIGLLSQQTLALETAYQAYRRDRGLLDYTDLELGFHTLLQRADLAADLAAEFELVCVDEFQDTSPLQLAIFQRLAELATESIWVGDPKQAIYGFRGCDAKLVEDAWAHVPDERRERLPKSWRSQAGLVELAGDIFASSFPGDDARLESVHEARDDGVERWLVGAGKVEQDAAGVARGVLGLHQGGTPLREIAVLCRTNRTAERVADSLREVGVPAAVRVPGILGTPECVMVRAGLQLVADRWDSLAAATILHLLEGAEPETPEWLSDRLRALREAEARGDAPGAPWPDHQVLAQLAAVDARVLDPAGVVTAVIEALPLGEILPRWGEAARRAWNLDTLVEHARRYQDHAGDHGSAATLGGLLLHLGALEEDGEDRAEPPQGLEAVTVFTYHRAKGLEWPVVVLADLAYERDPELWDPVATGGNAREGRPLEGRRIRFWVWPFGRELYGQLVKGSGLEDDAVLTPEGQQSWAAAGAERQRLLYVGFTRARDKVILAHRPGKYAWLDCLPGIDSVLDPGLAAGQHPLGSTGTRMTVRELDPGGEVECEERTEEHWLAELTAPRSTSPWRWHSPSAAPALEARCEVETLPGAPAFSGELRADPERLGNALHAYYAALPSLGATPEAGQERVLADRCLAAWSLDPGLAPAAIESGRRLRAWVEARHPGATWQTEVPLRGPRPAGGEWLGTADLVLHLPGGNLAILDHKSTRFEGEAAAVKLAQTHSGQLLAYRDALAADPATTELWIHNPLAGFMVGTVPA